MLVQTAAVALALFSPLALATNAEGEAFLKKKGAEGALSLLLPHQWLRATTTVTAHHVRHPQPT
jgi:hypothetical protein